MYTARQALIEHLDASKSGFGISTVKAYAGEIQAAINDPQTLEGLLPAVLVLMEDGTRLDGHGTYDINLLVVQLTQALDPLIAGFDPLLIAEGLWDWMESHFSWQATPWHYSLDLTEGGVKTLMAGSTFSVLQITLTHREVRIA